MKRAPGPAKAWVDFRAVKEAVSMEAVLRHYRVPGLGRLHGQLQGRCPNHGGERQDSFRASLHKNAFQCFACQARGDALDFVSAMESTRSVAMPGSHRRGTGSEKRMV